MEWFEAFADQLVESWINGNRSDVLQVLGGLEARVAVSTVLCIGIDHGKSARDILRAFEEKHMEAVDAVRTYRNREVRGEDCTCAACLESLLAKAFEEQGL